MILIEIGMGLWSRYSPDTLILSEERLLYFAQLSEKVEIRDVTLADGNWLHCVVCGDTEKPPLVMLHGYCGGGVVFYKLLSALAPDYHIFMVDLLGMGQSSRPPFYAETTEETEYFFVQALEEFRTLMGLEHFILLGHSFGGYVAGCYALAYPAVVTQLLFLSPVGVKQKPPEYSFEKSLLLADWKFRAFWRALSYLWLRNITPSSMLRKAGPMSRRLLRFYTRRRLLALKDEELEAMEDYLEQMSLLPGSGEYGLVYILEPGAYARKALSSRLGAVTVPMAFFYGARDWISPEGAIQVSQAASAPVAIKIIPDSGHQMYLENAEGLLHELLQVLRRPGERTELYPEQVWSGK